MNEWEQYLEPEIKDREVFQVTDGCWDLGNRLDGERTKDIKEWD